MKIYTKLIIALSSLSFFLLIIISTFIFSSTRDLLKQSSGNDAILRAERRIEIVDRMLYERYLNIQDIASSKTFEQLVAKGGSVAEAKSRLNEYKSLTGPWETLDVMDKRGDVLATTDPSEDKFDRVADRIAYEAALAGQVYYSDVVAGDGIKSVMIYAAPIRDGSKVSDPIIGVVIGSLNWQNVIDIMSEVSPPFVDHLYNRNGLMIASSRPADQNLLFKEKFDTHPVVSGAFGGEKGFLVGRGTSLNTGKLEESLIAAVPETGFAKYKGNGWIISVEVPSSVAFAPANDIAWRFVAVVGFTFIIYVFLLAFVLQINFINPLVILTEAVSEIGKGDLSRSIPIILDDEIGTLGASVNKMVASLLSGRLQIEQYSKGLEQKIAEKTKDLKIKIDDLGKAELAVLNVAEDADFEKKKAVEQTNRLQAILQSIGDGVVAMDKSWRVTIWNKAAASITGYKEEEVIGKPLRDYLKLYREHDRKENIVFIEEALLYGRQQSTDQNTFVVTKDGKEVPLGDIASPLFDRGGQVIGVIIVFRDLSKENEAKRLHSDFSYASHQMRTPISKSMGTLELAMSSMDVNEIKTNVKFAYDSIQSVYRLIDELLAMSAVDAGQIVPKMEVVDIKSIIDTAIKPLQAEIDKNNLKILIKLDPGAEIISDRFLLSKILSELISNAVNFSEAQSEIEISEGKTDNGLETLFMVKNSRGVGITEEDAPFVFTRYFRGSNFDTTRLIGGGLGLSLCKEYVSLLRGKIWFESTENKGATFYLRLPLKQ